MFVGVPKESKNNEYRVGMTPESVAQLVRNGHRVCVEANAGMGIGISDDDYLKVGAEIAADSREVFADAELIVKVKEPLATERPLIKKGQIIFTYLHLAADRQLTQELLDSGAVCIAYETVDDTDGHLPLLAPMSKIAGRLAAQVAAHYLQKPVGGGGRLIGGIPGVLPARAAVLGGGVVGSNAARILVGMGADVIILEKNDQVMDHLNQEFDGRVRTLFSSAASLHQTITRSDVVIGGILVPGEAAPKLVSEEMVREMRPGSIVVDVAIDQGGCVATARPTTHDDPVYLRHEVVHYCVTNMPGAVPHTSTYALNNVTCPYILQIANQGWQHAVKHNFGLLSGLSTVDGRLTCEHTGASLGMKSVSKSHYA